jgi:cell volume regulation protein A
MIEFKLHNYTLEAILLMGSLLLIISVLASRVSSRLGVPSLLLFLIIGMVAGSEGPGGIAFDDYPISFGIGSICLALIMFDGGLRTSWKTTRPILPLGISLSFVGTVVTGLVTSLFAYYILDFPWIGALLLGGIVSSTDAAAVFSILRARSLALRGSLKQTLEFEAGSNDPVAIFLTVTVLLMMSNPGQGLASILKLFVMQAGIGLLAGWYGGRVIRWLINHAGVEYEGLYGIFTLGLAVLLFAITSTLGGSGFLAVYIAGLYLGNAELLHKGSINRFVDGMAWLSQILVFLTLGLLVYPSHLLDVWKEGLLLGLFMMFVARPFSVFIASIFAKMEGNERLFVSWVGLRGAAPIILATLPWIAGVSEAEYYFNLVFFVVLISVIGQGISIPFVAKWLKVTVPMEERYANLTFEEFLPEGFSLVEIDIGEGPNVNQRRILELGLPEGVLLISLERDQRFMIPKGVTILRPGDRVRALARPTQLDELQRLGQVREVSLA